MELSLLHKLRKVDGEPTTVAEKTVKFKEIVLQPYNNDFAVFLLTFMNEESKDLKSILRTVDYIPEVYQSLCLSPSLLEVSNTVKVKHDESIVDSILEMFLNAFKSSKYLDQNLKIMVDLASECIPSETISISEISFNFIETVIKQGNLELISNLYQTSQIFKNDSTKYLRYMALFSKLSSYGKNEFIACQEIGALNEIVELCKKDDILVQMVALDMIQDIVKTHEGIGFLCSTGVLTWLIGVCCGNNTQILGDNNLSEINTSQLRPDPLLDSQAMRVMSLIFEQAAKLNYDLFNHIDFVVLRVFLSRICLDFEEGDESQRINGLVVLTQFCSISFSTFEMALNFHLTHQNEHITLFQSWFKLLVMNKTDLNAAFLRSLANILDIKEQHLVENNYADMNNIPHVFTSVAESKTNEDGNREKLNLIVEMKKKLFSTIGQVKNTDTLTYILKICQQPIENLRYAGIDILRAVATQSNPWGLLTLFNGPSIYAQEGKFWVYLKNRFTEFNKEGKDWKFSIIAGIAKSPYLGQLGEPIVEEVNKLVMQGPYYMPARVAEPMTMEH